MARGRRSTRHLDHAVRYPVITRRERLAAAWAGFLDGLKGLPAGEVAPDRLPPSCAVLHGTYASLLSRVEAQYRADEAGYAGALQAAVAARSVVPTGDPTHPGPEGRAIRAATTTRTAAVVAGQQAADQLQARHQQATADYQAVRAVAGQALGVYTRHLYRWHKGREDLSARNWLPPGLPLPAQRVGIRPDLATLLAELHDPAVPAPTQGR